MRFKLGSDVEKIYEAGTFPSELASPGFFFVLIVVFEVIIKNAKIWHWSSRHCTDMMGFYNIGVFVAL